MHACVRALLTLHTLHTLHTSSQLLRSLVLLTMVIKLAPTKTLLPRRGATVAATALDSQSQFSQLRLPVLQESGTVSNPPSRLAPPQAKKVCILEPGHDNHIIDPDVAVRNNLEELIKVATETASFVLSASLICLRLPLLGESKNSGAWLRSQAVLHAQKHADRFGKLFPSKAESETWLNGNA